MTPFDGRKTKGAPVVTIVRGQVIMRDGQIVGSAAGRMVRPRVGGAAPAREPVPA